MRRVVQRALGVLSVVVLLPGAVLAQGSIAGNVKDPSGSVLPGVTVEAASPALIEKTRTAITDGGGLYKIENLRPGTYTVTFMLTGFSTVKREGIQLEGAATISINAEMNVGAIEQTITVTGEAPSVDVQSPLKERVLTAEVVNTIPTGRLYSDLGALVPGIKQTAGTVSGTNVGGALGDSQANLQIHGSKAGDMRIMENGVPTATLQAAGSLGIATPNVGAMQEVSLDTGAVSAELATGGPRINMIPKDGGNIFSGSTFGSYSNNSMQGNNFTSRLQALGLKVGSDQINKNGDFNFGIGGPVEKNRLWFYTTIRALVADLYPSGISPNLNANNPNAWTYVADTSKKAEANALWTDGQIRLTWQANAKNKFAGTWDQQTRCSCPYYASATRSPEAGGDRHSPTQRFLHGEWFSPITSRFLAEVVALHRTERWSTDPPSQYLSDPFLTGVVEQSTGMQYRGGGQAGGTFNNNWLANYAYRAAVSYVTGAHAFKAGWNDIFGTIAPTTYNFSPLLFRFNNGVPNQLTEFATPYTPLAEENHDFGMFAQDKWTVKRLTVSGGIRYDWFKSGFPAQTVGPALLIPNRNISFPATPDLNWKDITPRMGAVYDLTGDGKTAVRVSANKYLAGQALNGLGSTPNPINSLALSTTRSWTDTNQDFVPNCDLLNPSSNGECGAMTNRNFGSTQPVASFDPDLLTGWGHRSYNWEFSAGVQREIVPRLSVDVAYFRRVYGNFAVVDNTLVAPSDYNAYSITAPLDPRLPGGGGYTISGLYDLNPSKVGAVQNYNTLSDKIGNQTDHWNGIDITVNARLQNGLTIQGGLSTGKETTDDCAIVAQLPEMLLGLPTATSLSGSITTTGVLQPQSYCHMAEPWLFDFRMQSTYTIPKVAVQIAASFQSVPGPPVLANYTATNAVVQPSLQRPLSGGAQNVSINLVAPGSLYGERYNQLDLRFSKVLTAGRAKARVGVDVYNALNTDAVIQLNNSFASWQTPTQAAYARFLKLSATFDF